MHLNEKKTKTKLLETNILVCTTNTLSTHYSYQNDAVFVFVSFPSSSPSSSSPVFEKSRKNPIKWRRNICTILYLPACLPILPRTRSDVTLKGAYETIDDETVP